MSTDFNFTGLNITRNLQNSTGSLPGYISGQAFTPTRDPNNTQQSLSNVGSLSAIRIELNPNDPNATIYAKDTVSNQFIARWDNTTNKWVSMDIGQRFITDNEILINNKEFKDQTTKIIESLNDQQKSAFKDSSKVKFYEDKIKRTETDEFLQSVGGNSETDPGPESNPQSAIRVNDFNPNDLKNRYNATFGNYTYPNGESKQDKIKFTPMELNLDSGIIGGILDGDTANNSLGLAYNSNINRRTFRSVQNGGSVTLGIQGPITDENSVDWADGNVSPVDAVLYNAAMEQFKNGDEKDIIGMLGGAGESLIDATGDVAGKMFNDGLYKQLFASLAANNLSLFTRGTSLSLNPNLELLFRQPQLRPFQFTFLLSSVDDKESEQIKSIIKFFKYHMAVKVPDTIGLFLRSPHVFAIDYLDDNNAPEHPGLNRIAPIKQETKACALTNFSVDYTPMGSYMTYGDKTMIAYRINMSFREIVPIYDTDYNNNHPIGY